MTTGCICPGCGGLTGQQGEPCRGCEISAMPPGIGKAISAAADRLLYGARIQVTERFGPCDKSTVRSAEAGS